jgi:adhesin transport system membrane fusion protein
MMWVLGIVGISVLVLILWMAWAEIDIVVRGGGKVIPSSQLQLVQSLEGGVVTEILVREGDVVEQNQPLMRISDIGFASSYEENRLRYLELRARIARLDAQANEKTFELDPDVIEEAPSLMEAERRLYESQTLQYQQALSVLEEQLSQHRNELIEAQARERQLGASAELIRDEVRIKTPLAQSGLISEVEFIQLRRQATEIEGNLENVSLSIPRIRSRIQEAERKLEQTRLELVNRAKTELNEAQAEVSRLREAGHAIRDRVSRTTLRAPVHGVVKRIFVNTVGGVIRPGGEVIEVVPLEDALLVEVRINPADIADVSVELPARIKFSAYDFSIHGSLAGEVVFIGADSITNEDGDSYFIARIRPGQNHIDHVGTKLPIMVGMTTQVDILTGKRSILNYLLKPIHRGMDNAMGER